MICGSLNLRAVRQQVKAMATPKLRAVKLSNNRANSRQRARILDTARGWGWGSLDMWLPLEELPPGGLPQSARSVLNPPQHLWVLERRVKQIAWSRGQLDPFHRTHSSLG